VRVALLSLWGAALLGLSLRAAEPPPARPVLVGGTTDNYPYSFLDDRKQLSGFAVDVFDASARQMNLQYTRVLAPASEVATRFLAGEITVHPFFSRSQNGTFGAYEFSVPFVSLQMTVFKRRGDTRILTVEDLKRPGIRIAVGGAGMDYARAHGIPGANLLRAANNDAFEFIASEKADAAIFTRLVGLAAIERLGLKKVTAADFPLPDSIREYRFAVAKGEAHLLAQLNEGLASIQRTGEYDAIYQKWFGRFEPRRFTREEVIVYVAAALALALAVTFWALLRQRQLRRRLARQTDELAESRAILAEAQQFARVGHWQRISATGELLWSDETYRIYERDPARGTPGMEELLSWVSPADRIVWERSARLAREEGHIYEFDTTIEPHPGVRKTIHIRGRPTRNAGGQITGLFGTVQDITPWREAEHALLRSERLLRAIYDNIPYAMGVVEFRDGSWRHVSLNPGAVLLLDLPKAPAPGLTLAEFGLSEDRQKFWHELFDRAASTSNAVTSERHNEEKNRDYVISVVPLGRSGANDRCCFFVEDVTERRQKDAEISQGRRLRAIGELVGGIAHEFNNLLTPILLKADLLKAEWSHEPALVEELQVIADTARRSADLTRRLLTFGRRAEVKPTLFTLSAIVEGNFKLLRHTIDRRIRLEATLPENLPSLYLNSSDVQQILLNLLLNARDTLVEKLARPQAAGWNPSIQVSATSLPGSAAAPLDRSKPVPPAWIKLTCLDNGMGMAPEVIERVFEPFYTTKQVGQGTGLGLATVWHLITEMGGRVDVASTAGIGTAFHIFLPGLAAAAPSTISTPPFAAPPPAPPCAMGERPHLLLAEDEPVIADIVTQVLRHLGCDVTHVADGNVAWTTFSANPSAFDALILDLNMPGISGLEFLRRVRRLGYRRPALITSGRIGEEERQELLSLHVTALLQKPFTVDKLISALSEAGISHQART
jgi:two-component system cell cycle sensor histidine kinase/response regulator CckA